MRPNRFRQRSALHLGGFDRACARRLAACQTAGDDDRLDRTTGSPSSALRKRMAARGRNLERALSARIRRRRRSRRSVMPRPCGRPASGRRPPPCSNRPRSTIRRTPRLLGAYGRALADIGGYNQALEVLSRAHTPDQPDWRILSAQGAVLDQMGRHEDARRHYASALKIVPDEPSVLSNLGLSYALSKNLRKAEETLRRPTSTARRERKVAAESRAGGRTAGPFRRSRRRSRAATCRPTKRRPMSPICAR